MDKTGEQEAGEPGRYYSMLHESLSMHESQRDLVNGSMG
jgi:hypothetical protein